MSESRVKQAFQDVNIPKLQRNEFQREAMINASSTLSGIQDAVGVNVHARYIRLRNVNEREFSPAEECLRTGWKLAPVMLRTLVQLPHPLSRVFYQDNAFDDDTARQGGVWSADTHFFGVHEVRSQYNVKLSRFDVSHQVSHGSGVSPAEHARLSRSYVSLRGLHLRIVVLLLAEEPHVGLYILQSEKNARQRTARHGPPVRRSHSLPISESI